MSKIQNTKVMKYQIVKPLDCDWKIFDKILNSIKEEVRYIKNKTVQLAWEFMNCNAIYKEKTGAYYNLKDSGILGVGKTGKSNNSSISNYCYSALVGDGTISNALNLVSSIKTVADIFEINESKARKRDKPKVMRILTGEERVPHYTKDTPIDVAKIKVYCENNQYMLELPLISNEYRKQLNEEIDGFNRMTGQFMVLISAKDSSQRAILKNIIDGKYSVSTSQIKKNGRKWFVHLVYKFESETKELDPNKTLGIDLGIVNTAAMQIYNKASKSYEWVNQSLIDGSDIIHFRQKIEARRNCLKKQAKYASKGRVGHGRKTRMKPVLRLGDKIANFRDTKNHAISREIINLALKHQCKTIQMEDLNGIAQITNEKFLKNWSYYDLQAKIEYKAKEHGIEIIKVSPRFTSQRCSTCGHIHSENRKNQSMFKCMECGFELNADLNAARNIAIPNIDVIIKEWLKNNDLNNATVA